MTPALAPLRAIARQGREHGAALRAAADDPHTELLTLFWGPQFDREHAFRLWARLSRQAPVQAQPVLPALLAAGEQFDALDRGAQQRLRHLILRHRALVH
jgi:hypothetical protein